MRKAKIETLRLPFGAQAISLDWTDLGATCLSWNMPLPSGITRDLILAVPSVEHLPSQDCYFGATVGRVANRIGPGGFDLDGCNYPLEANQFPNHLHGGHPGLHEKFWNLSRISEQELRFEIESPAGEAGYPGTLQVVQTVRLEAVSNGAALTLEYEAETDAPTLCNLTWHGYWNLLGQEQNHLHGQFLRVESHAFTELDETGCPTGRILPVAQTGLDYRVPRDLGKLDWTCPHVRRAAGVDHNFILKTRPSQELRLAAEVCGGGLRLVCETSQSGLQVYTGNYLEGVPGKGGKSPDFCYQNQAGFCLETQAWPDAPHHENFPSIVLRPGKKYRECTRYTVTWM